MARKESRSCELCTSEAKTFCESDQARLCWDCDEKVHAANFLVAKHSRTVLCGVCHSPTPWKASGLKVGRAVSVCGTCVTRSAASRAGSGGGVAPEAEDGDARSRSFRIGQREEIDDDDEYSDDDDSSDDDDFDEDNEEDENQVVPTETSCSEAEACESPPYSNVEIGASSSTARSRPAAQEEDDDGEFTKRPLKQRKLATLIDR